MTWHLFIFDGFDDENILANLNTASFRNLNHINKFKWLMSWYYLHINKFFKIIYQISNVSLAFPKSFRMEKIISEQTLAPRVNHFNYNDITFSQK